MTGPLARLLARPLADRDRRRAFVAVAIGLLLTAAALTLIAPPRAERAAPLAHRTVSTPALSPSTTRPSAPAGPPPVMVDAGRRFLQDYLNYLYGHTRGRTFAAASASLRRSLASHPARVSPAMRRRHPHVADLTGHRLQGGSRWVLTATIADGGAARYPVELVIATRLSGAAVVVGLGED
jgi:hypothetical protein